MQEADSGDKSQVHLCNNKHPCRHQGDKALTADWARRRSIVDLQYHSSWCIIRGITDQCTTEYEEQSISLASRSCNGTHPLCQYNPQEEDEEQSCQRQPPLEDMWGPSVERLLVKALGFCPLRGNVLNGTGFHVGARAVHHGCCKREKSSVCVQGTLTMQRGRWLCDL